MTDDPTVPIEVEPESVGNLFGDLDELDLIDTDEPDPNRVAELFADLLFSHAPVGHRLFSEFSSEEKALWVFAMAGVLTKLKREWAR